MEVGEHEIDDVELITRADEQAGVAAEWREFAILRGRFQAANNRRSNCDYTSTARPRRCNLHTHIACHFGAFGMHSMLTNVIDAHRLKGTSADMQRDMCGFHTCF